MISEIGLIHHKIKHSRICRGDCELRNGEHCAKKKRIG